MHARRLKSDPGVFSDAEAMKAEAAAAEAEEAEEEGEGGAEEAEEVEEAPRGPLEAFLFGLGFSFVGYAEPLRELGVARPGDLADLTLAQLVEAGVKKVHARALKDAPAVAADADAMREAVAERLRLSAHTPARKVPTFRPAPPQPCPIQLALLVLLVLLAPKHC